MGFLERARSQRGRHQRARSSRIEDHSLQGQPTQLKRSATRVKRKSIFPGLSSNSTVSTTCEASQPKSKSARASINHTNPEEKAVPKEQQVVEPSRMHFQAGNESFRFPSPALVNDNPKGTPLSSITPLPPIRNNSSNCLSALPQAPSKTLPPAWGRSVTDPVLSTKPQPVLTAQAQTWEPQQDEKPAPQIRKQRSAWKSLGGLFKGKQSRPPIPEPFYQVQPSSNDSSATSSRKVGVLDSPLPSPARIENRPTRVDSGHSSPGGSDEKRVKSQSRPPRVDSLPGASRRPSEKSVSLAHQNEGTEVEDPQKTPKLDIDIPGGGFDRYSVMFEKLLEPRVSLLERRQSKRMQLNPGKVDDKSRDLADVPAQSSIGLQRSLTSPSLNRMPSLTIRVHNSNRADHPKDQYNGPIAHRPRPPKRAMTTPRAAQSPLSALAKGVTPVTARPITIIKPAAVTTSSSPASPSSFVSENSLPPTPTTATSLASSVGTTVFGPSPPKAKTVSPPPPIPTRSSDRPPMPRNPPTGTESFNRQIVQVSVARQVSVSRARRRVADAVEVKQPLRPRVVDLTKNRKSTLVMIEGGD